MLVRLVLSRHINEALLHQQFFVEPESIAHSLLFDLDHLSKSNFHHFWYIKVF